MDLRQLPLPPAARGLPWLGQLRAFLRDPLTTLSSMSQEQGPVCRFRLGPQRAVLVVRAEDVGPTPARGCCGRHPERPPDCAPGSWPDRARGRPHALAVATPGDQTRARRGCPPDILQGRRISQNAPNRKSLNLNDPHQGVSPRTTGPRSRSRRRAAQQGAAADRATASSDRRLVVFGIETWALRTSCGGGPGS